MTLPIAIATITLLPWVGVALRTLQGHRKLQRLGRVRPAGPDEPPLPRLSIVVTAHNEERLVDRALRSFLALRYPDYEVVFVNDRSSDRTGQIAESLSAEDARLKVLHINELPPGWFGKPHAARRGADLATGEILLFTDGDAVFAPDAAARGVQYLIRERLDHLSASPRVPHTGTMLQACTIALRLFGSGRKRLWKVQDRRSSVYWGIGPYTMMSTKFYREIGGHEQVALRPDEDVRLGQFVKLSGGRSAHVDGSALVDFVWYHSIPEFVRGLQTRLFAISDYSIPKATATIVLLTWLALAPLILGPLFLSADQVVAGLLLLAGPIIGWSVAMSITRRIDSFPWWSAIPLPAAMLVFAYVTMRSMLVTILRGVTWGGLSVPLAELKTTRVRVRDSSS